MLSSPEDLSELEPISTLRLGILLEEHRVRNVLLNACDSARADTHVEANLAAGLLKTGIQNVIGMSYDLNVSAAQIFVREFYESILIERLHIAAATARGRRALQEVKARRARFKLEVNLEDWIVPVFYQSTEGSAVDGESFSLPPRKDIYGSTTSFMSIRDQPRTESSLIGRDGDLLCLEMSLLKDRCIELKGPPGVGLTSLIKNAASWWTSTKLIQGVRWYDMESDELNEEGEDAGGWWLRQFISISVFRSTFLSPVKRNDIDQY